MDFLGQLLRPNGFWENMIFGLETIVKDYGLTLIVITLIIKTAMLPFDFLNRYIGKNNSRKQAKIKPELEKLQKAYANNPNMLNQKTMELYKRENFNIMGTCLGMLANMAVTMVVFFTLFAALNGIATYKQADEFVVLYNTYYETIEEQSTLNQTLTEQELEVLAQQAVVDIYGDIRADFLWIKNIWKPDTTTSAIASYKDFSKNVKSDVQKELTEQQGSEVVITEAEYNKILSQVKQEFGGANGYYILIILSASITFMSMQLTTWLNQLKAKKKGKVYVDPVGSNKVLVYMLPIIMAVFTLFYNAAFGIYIVAGSVFSLLTAPFVTMLADMLDEKVMEKEQNKVTVSYSRNKK